jgi:hypothetical protein
MTSLLHWRQSSDRFRANPCPEAILYPLTRVFRLGSASHAHRALKKSEQHLIRLDKPSACHAVARPQTRPGPPESARPKIG